jgi:hypothetical protein
MARQGVPAIDRWRVRSMFVLAKKGRHSSWRTQVCLSKRFARYWNLKAKGTGFVAAGPVGNNFHKPALRDINILFSFALLPSSKGSSYFTWKNHPDSRFSAPGNNEGSFAMTKVLMFGPCP